MDLTRSKPQEADTENAARVKAPAKVTSANSGANLEEESAIKDRIWSYKPILPLKKIVALPRSSGKYYEMDERMLAMGIFIDTVKEERLKNDPDFAFTKEFYRTVIHDFDALNDDTKACYFAEAKKRNTIEDEDLASKRVVVKTEKRTKMDTFVNVAIDAKAVKIFFAAVKAEHFKNKPGEPYDPSQISYFVDLKNEEERDPYLAEATVRQLEEATEKLKLYKDYESD